MTVILLVIVTETLLVTRILKVTVTETETDKDSMFVVYRRFVTIDLVKLPSLPRVSHSRNMCCCMRRNSSSNFVVIVSQIFLNGKLMILMWSCGELPDKCTISKLFCRTHFMGRCQLYIPQYR